ncbi:fasciclin domain-containing protein [uncultured Microbacterium sp.]|uniref:fasciclin domain-containing protein n=1 Tax=uncultured Microbacterium sp. TaxID=191216 RepID=UPI0025FF792B|nr:fasciclin domain-containing protein [uncultured Microbacterium sp.]
MMFRTKKLAAAASLGFAGLLVLSGCSMGSGSSSESSSPSSAPSTEMPSSSPSMDPAADLVGPGCADYAKAVPDGGGSISGMAEAPVATAASNNPLLKTLVSAVSGKLNPDVNLVDTLNGSQFTVFAPVDDAFAKIPASTIDGLKTDSATLTKILTYHVVPGQIAPSDIAGTHKTVEGADLTVTGSGDNLMVGDAKVICGGVHTANATVYLIDSVLMPPAN